MASKKFKGKACAYCGQAGASESGDHVFAREFILVRHRANLPQVPACRPCNSEKSRLETHLMQIMPMGANHSDGLETSQTLMPKRASNPANKVLRGIIEGPHETVWLSDQTGQRHQRIPVLVDANVLQDWCGLVARGLACFHSWGVVTSDYMVETEPITAEEEQSILSAISEFKGMERVDCVVGSGAFAYRGFRCTDGGSMWLLYLYGSMPIGGDPAASRACAWSWRVFIRPKDMAPNS